MISNRKPICRREKIIILCILMELSVSLIGCKIVRLYAWLSLMAAYNIQDSGKVMVKQ